MQEKLREERNDHSSYGCGAFGDVYRHHFSNVHGLLHQKMEQMSPAEFWTLVICVLCALYLIHEGITHVMTVMQNRHAYLQAVWEILDKNGIEVPDTYQDILIEHCEIRRKDGEEPLKCAFEIADAMDFVHQKNAQPDYRFFSEEGFWETMH